MFAHLCSQSYNIDMEDINVLPYDKLELDYSKIDNIHFSCSCLDGFQKPFNCAFSVREDGKTASFDYGKAIKKLQKYHATPTYFLRQVNEVSEYFVSSLEGRWNKWLLKPIRLYYRKKDLDNGLAMLYLDKQHKCPACNVVSLAKPLDILKKFFIERPGDFLLDEFILDMRNGSRYCKKEVFKVKEVYTTFYREWPNAGVPRPRFYAFGNPYTLYNPYFAELNIDTSKIKEQGNVQIRDNWVVMHHKVSPELLEFLRKTNPLYSVEDEYAKYANGGIAINDMNVRIMEKCPNDFTLDFCFYANGKCFGVFLNNRNFDNLSYWIGELKDQGKRRTIYSLNFGDLIEGSALISYSDKILLGNLKDAIAKRAVGYQTLEANYLIEEVYKIL